MVVHVTIDLGTEEVGGQEHAGPPVPGRQSHYGGIGREGAAGVLVKADRHGDVGFAVANRLCGHLQRRAARSAAIEDSAHRNAGGAKPADDRVGIGHLVAADVRGLHPGPFGAGIGKGRLRRFCAHLQAQLVAVAAERMKADADDRDVGHDAAD